MEIDKVEELKWELPTLRKAVARVVNGKIESVHFQDSDISIDDDGENGIRELHEMLTELLAHVDMDKVMK